MTHYNLFLKRDTSRMNTPVQRPKRTVFGPTAGLTSPHPLYKGADAMPLLSSASHTLPPHGGTFSNLPAPVPPSPAGLLKALERVYLDQAEKMVLGQLFKPEWFEAPSKELDHQGVVLVGDVWMRPGALRRLNVVSVWRDSARVRFESEGYVVEGSRAISKLLGQYILVGRSAKPQRKLRVRDRVSDVDFGMGTVAGFGMRGDEGHRDGVWVRYDNESRGDQHDGAFYTYPESLTLVEPVPVLGDEHVGCWAKHVKLGNVRLVSRGNNPNEWIVKQEGAAGCVLALVRDIMSVGI